MEIFLKSLSFYESRCIVFNHSLVPSSQNQIFPRKFKKIWEISLLVTSELDLDLREILSGGRVTKFFQKVEEKI